MEGILLNACEVPFARELVKMLSDRSEPDFFLRLEINLLSLIYIYICRTTGASKFEDIFPEIENLLANLNSANELRNLPNSLSDDYKDIKELWKTDAFFHTSEGWEEQDNGLIRMTLLTLKRKVDKYHRVVKVKH